MDPVARARAIAARLAASAIPQDTLGKRKSRWEDDADGSAGPKKHKKVYIPVDKYPDINFMGLLIGPRGSNQKRMEDESGAKILIRGKGSSKDPTGEPDEEEELHVLITGETDEAIAKAQSAVENILFNPQEAMRLKQEQLRKVAELNGTLNENYGRPDSASASNGPGHYGPGTGSGSDSNSTEMEVPRDLVGYIIGRGGDTIRELQTKSGARIQIVREEPGAPQTAYRSVSIAGTDDAVDTAKVLIQRLIDERMNGGRDFGSRDGDRPRYGGLNPDGSETMEFHVPNERVGLIIGRGGATIKNIQMRTGASINIPQTADPANPSMRLITITGTRDAKESAKVEILSIMNDDGGPRGGGNTIYMQVPNDRVGVVIGKRGETVKAMQDRYGVRIQIPTVADSTNPSVRTISIQGPPDAVHRAKEEIDAVILNGAGTQGTASYGSSQYGSSYYGSGYDQYQYGSGQYGYDQSQYDAYYQQYYQQAADCSTATASSSDAAAATTSVAADPASAPGTEGAAAAAPAGASATADPNDYWNGFYEYAAYYGIDAANEAWGVTGEAAKASAESYRQYQEQAAAAAAAGVAAVATDGTSSGADTTTSDSTTAPSKVR